MTTHLAKHMHSKLEITGTLVTYNDGLPLYRIDKLADNNSASSLIPSFFFVLVRLNHPTLYTQTFNTEHDAINCARKGRLVWRSLDVGKHRLNVLSVDVSTA